MSDESTHYLQDCEWLIWRIPEASENMQDAFSDKVCKLMSDLFLSEDKARQAALKMIEEGKLWIR